MPQVTMRSVPLAFRCVDTAAPFARTHFMFWWEQFLPLSGARLSASNKNPACAGMTIEGGHDISSVIASQRGARSREPLARNDDLKAALSRLLKNRTSFEALCVLAFRR